MKEIIYNYENLNEEAVNRVSTRIKAVIVNSNNEILLCRTANNYHLPGGHLEEGETVNECLVREIKEETGIELSIVERKPFFSIKYFSKDYPTKGINTKSVANYYVVDTELKPNLDNISLTEEEKNGNFELQYININEVLKVLEDSLNVCTKVAVVEDTIEAVKEYIKSNL